MTYEQVAPDAMVKRRPPVMVPVIAVPEALWNGLPHRYGTGTIAWCSWLLFAGFLTTGMLLGDFDGLEQAARDSGEVLPALISIWFPMSLFIAPALGWMAGRRSAWVCAGLSLLTALALQYGSDTAATPWWIAAVTFLAGAVLTTLPGVRQLLALARLAVRGRRDPQTPRAPIPYEEIRKATETGHLKSHGPLYMFGLFVVLSVISAFSLSTLREHPEGAMAGLESLGSRDPLEVYPLVLAGFLPWSVLGLLRLLLESIIGHVVWIIPAGAGGPVDFGRLKPLADGSNTVDGVPLEPDEAPDEASADGTRRFAMMWLAGVGGERQGALMKWNADRELVVHRYADRSGRERLRALTLPGRPKRH